MFVSPGYLKEKTLLHFILEGKDVRYVFMDVDHTLVRGNAGRTFSFFLLRRGHLRWMDIAAIPGQSLLYALGLLDYTRVLEKAISAWSGKTLNLLSEEGGICYEKKVRPMLYPQARPLIEGLRKAGLEVVLVSASPRELLCHMSSDLGGLPLITTELEDGNGHGQVKVKGELCYGKGKLHKVKAFLAERGDENVPFCALSDSISDLPLLLAAASPIAVNPDLRLLGYAKMNRMPLFRF